MKGPHLPSMQKLRYMQSKPAYPNPIVSFRSINSKVVLRARERVMITMKKMNRKKRERERETVRPTCNTSPTLIQKAAGSEGTGTHSPSRGEIWRPPTSLDLRIVRI